LLLERAANAPDATAAFLLAQTYDPAVLKVRDMRSITPDPVIARDWYRKAASFGSAEAQQRLTQPYN
jgi:TPR repeat protein